MGVHGNYTGNDSKKCETLYDGKHYLTDLHKQVLIYTNVFIILGNVITNALVLRKLLKKDLLKNISLKLIFYLCLSDFGIALLAQPVFIFLLVDHRFSFHCIFDIIAEFVIVFAINLSELIVVLVGFDRYFRLKSLNRYNEIINVSRLRVALLVVWLIALLQGFMVVLGTHLHIFHAINLIAVCADILIIAVIGVTYAMSLKAVKKHRRLTINKEFLYSIEHHVTTMASRILLALIILISPYMSTAVLHHWLIDKSRGRMRENLNFALFAGYELIFVNCSANALIMLTLGKGGMGKKTREITSKNEHSEVRLPMKGSSPH